GIEDYDKTKSSLIRGDIGKIRHNLTRYYASAADACVRIEIPKHALAAKFSYIRPPAPTVPPASPPVSTIGTSRDPEIPPAVAQPDVRWPGAPIWERILLIASFLASMALFFASTIRGEFAAATVVLVFA